MVRNCSRFYNKLVFLSVDELPVDMKQGQGRFDWKNNSSYCGSWANDRMNGFGVRTYCDGSRAKGFFRNGFLHGEVELVHKVTKPSQSTFKILTFLLFSLEVMDFFTFGENMKMRGFL